MQLSFVCSLVGNKGNIMTDNAIKFKDKLLIIKNADLVDARILDTNYARLIIAAVSHDEKEKFLILRKNTQDRIKELS